MKAPRNTGLALQCKSWRGWRSGDGKYSFGWVTVKAACHGYAAFILKRGTDRVIRKVAFATRAKSKARAQKWLNDYTQKSDAAKKRNADAKRRRGYYGGSWDTYLKEISDGEKLVQGSPGKSPDDEGSERPAR